MTQTCLTTYSALTIFYMSLHKSLKCRRHDDAAECFPDDFWLFEHFSEKLSCNISCKYRCGTDQDSVIIKLSKGLEGLKSCLGQQELDLENV